MTPKRPRRVSTGRSSPFPGVDEFKILPPEPEKKEKKKQSSTRSKLSKCPAYPTAEPFVASEKVTTVNDLLAEILAHEAASCKKVFSEDYAFVADAIASVTQTITQRLNAIEPPAPKVIPHPSTLLRQQACTTFEAFLAKADEEIRRWESMRTVHADRDSFAKSQIEEKNARRKHAETQLCRREVELSESLRTTYSTLAIKGDQLLRCLKMCKTRLADTGKYISLVSDAVNQTALAPYYALSGDPKSLIRALSA